MKYIYLIVFIVFIVFAIIVYFYYFSRSLSLYSPSATPSPTPINYLVIEDSAVDGQIQPYFCYGNPFVSSGTKTSFDKLLPSHNVFTRPNLYPQYKVFGVGDNVGAGWLGGDSDGSIELENGDLIFVYGDSFLGKINNPNVWTAYRDDNAQMPHNSISYLKTNKQTSKIQQHLFYIGQSPQNLSNKDGLGFDAGCPFTYQKNNMYKQNPYHFSPNGCQSLLQPSIIDPKLNLWLYGGMSKGNDIAILAGIVQGVQSEGFQFIEIKDVVNGFGLSKNPFLWDTDPTTRKILLSENIQGVNNDIRYAKMIKDRDGTFVLFGGKNLKPGTAVYLIRGTYDQLIEQRGFQAWSSGEWRIVVDETQQLDMTPLIINNNQIYGPAYFSEFYFSEACKTYCFYSLSTDLYKKWIIIRYNSLSKNIEGPYDIDHNFNFVLPDWINATPGQFNVYALRVHPGLVNKVAPSAPDRRIEMVLSYICQGDFPQYSGYIFSQEYSAYNVYYPQFLMIETSIQ
jgi:hypothetical protein